MPPCNFLRYSRRCNVISVTAVIFNIKCFNREPNSQYIFLPNLFTGTPKRFNPNVFQIKPIGTTKAIKLSVIDFKCFFLWKKTNRFGLMNQVETVSVSCRIEFPFLEEKYSDNDNNLIQRKSRVLSCQNCSKFCLNNQNRIRSKPTQCHRSITAESLVSTKLAEKA